MQQMLEELQTISGVVGAAVFSSVDGLLANTLPRIFKPERLVAVGEQLSKLYATGQLSFTDLTDITLNYDESVVVARSLDESSLAFVYCEPEYSHNLLTTSLNLLQDDFSAGRFDNSSAATAMPAQDSSGGAGLSGLFDALQERLRKILGPMADFVFEEHLETWRQGGDDASRLDELIDAICDEIGDEEKIERYRQLISPDLQAFRKG